MIQQTIFPFKIATTKEVLTARGGLALFAEYNHGIGLPEVGALSKRIGGQALTRIWEQQGICSVGICKQHGIDAAGRWQEF